LHFYFPPPYFKTKTFIQSERKMTRWNVLKNDDDDDEKNDDTLK